jgi:hypothetical protein
LQYLSSENGTFLVTKSIPIVGLVFSSNLTSSPPSQCDKMLDLPTPELPITTTLAMVADQSAHCCEFGAVLPQANFKLKAGSRIDF